MYLLLLLSPKTSGTLQSPIDKLEYVYTLVTSVLSRHVSKCPAVLEYHIHYATRDYDQQDCTNKRLKGLGHDRRIQILVLRNLYIQRPIDYLFR